MDDKFDEWKKVFTSDNFNLEEFSEHYWAFHASKDAWEQIAKKHSDEVREAMERGYPLGNRVEKEVIDLIIPKPPESMSIKRARFECERNTPSMKAYDLQDKLVLAVKNCPLPVGTEIEVGRISSVSYTDMNGVGWRRTAIPIYIKAAHIKTKTVWYLIDEGDDNG